MPRAHTPPIWRVLTAILVLFTLLFSAVPAHAETGLIVDPHPSGVRIRASLELAGDAVAIRSSGRFLNVVDPCGVTYGGPTAFVAFSTEENLSLDAVAELAFADDPVTLEGNELFSWADSAEAVIRVQVRRLLREERISVAQAVVVWLHRDLLNRPVCSRHFIGSFGLDAEGALFRVPVGFATPPPPAPPVVVAPPATPLGALGTCKGPKTISQMREELIPVGYPGPFDQLSVLAAWQRTACAPAPTAAAPAAPAPTGACTSHGRIASSGPTSTAYGLTPLGGLTEACAVVGEVNGGPLGGFVVIVPAFTVAHIEGHHGWTSWFVDPAQAMAAAQNSSSGITARTGSAPRLVDLSKGETFPLLKRIQRG